MTAAWTETIVTGTDFQREVSTGKYSPRVAQHDIFMLLFQARGVRMTGPCTLAIAPPFEMAHEQDKDRVVVRQGPAA